jgi:cytidylate kinase
MGYIIAVDGPAGAGKSTVAKQLAKALNFTYIDSGAMYRSFTLNLIENKVNIENENEVLDLLTNTDISFMGKKILVDNKDVTKKIRSKEVDNLVSRISTIPEVRHILIANQRKISANKDVVMDGRDIGTVVFPNANIKIYLTADVEERAKRRTAENISKGIKINYEEILSEIKKRDTTDQDRVISPLRPAEDAILIDTTHKTVEEVVNEILAIMEG